MIFFFFLTQWLMSLNKWQFSPGRNWMFCPLWFGLLFEQLPQPGCGCVPRGWSDSWVRLAPRSVCQPWSQLHNKDVRGRHWREATPGKTWNNSTHVSRRIVRAGNSRKSRNTQIIYFKREAFKTSWGWARDVTKNAMRAEEHRLGVRAVGIEILDAP